MNLIGRFHCWIERSLGGRHKWRTVERHKWKACRRCGLVAQVKQRTLIKP